VGRRRPRPREDRRAAGRAILSGARGTGRALLIAALAASAGAAGANAVAAQSGSAVARDTAAVDTAGRYVRREVAVAGQSHRFSVWLPPGFERRSSWPAIVFLHGAGECGGDGVRPTQIGLGPALAAAPGRWPFVVVFPQKPLSNEEWEERENLVLAVLDRTQREFRIDPRRIALAGLSQGGHGVWMLGARHPERWSCLVPICGYGRAATVASRVARIPVWAFHGLRDDVIDPDDSRQIAAAIVREREGLGLDLELVRLTLFPEANHNAWDPAFAEPGLPGWILERARPR
jgi:predicted peptidase